MARQTRIAARGILLSPQDRILLVEMKLPWLGHIWMVPGGGQEAGETLEETASRELREETGLRDAAVGPRLYWRTLTIDTGSQTHELLEHYFLVPTDEFTPTALELTEEEEGWLCGHRWWSADEIRASRERFAPPEIADLLANLVTHGPQPLRRIGSAEHQAERDGRR